MTRRLAFASCPISASFFSFYSISFFFVPSWTTQFDSMISIQITLPYLFNPESEGGAVFHFKGSTDADAIWRWPDQLRSSISTYVEIKHLPVSSQWNCEVQKKETDSKYFTPIGKVFPYGGIWIPLNHDPCFFRVKKSFQQRSKASHYRTRTRMNRPSPITEPRPIIEKKENNESEKVWIDAGWLRIFPPADGLFFAFLAEIHSKWF